MTNNHKGLYALIAVIVLTVAQMFLSQQAHAQPTSNVPNIYTHGCQVGIGIVHIHLKLYESYKHTTLVEICEGVYSALPTLRREYAELQSGFDKFSFACGAAVGVGLASYDRRDILADEPTLIVLAEQCLTVARTLQKDGYFKNQGEK